MPVDMSIPNSILSAYIAGQRQKFARQTKARDQEQRQQQIDEQKRQHDILQNEFNQQLEFHKNQFAATNRLKEAEYDLALETARQQMAQHLGGIAPEGEPEENVQTVKLGGKLGDIRVLSPKGQVARATPMMDAQTNQAITKAAGIAQATQPYKLEQIEQTATSHAQTLKDMEQMRHANALELLKLKDKLGKDSIGYKLGLQHMYKMQENQAMGPDDMETQLENFKNGVHTLEDQGKMGYKQPQRALINNTLAQQGFVALKDKEQAEIRSMAVVRSMYKDIEDLNTAIKNKDWTTAVIKQDAFRAKRGVIANIMGGQKGAISERDVQAMDAYQQSIVIDPKAFWNTAKANDLRVAQFRKDVLAKQRSVLGRFKLPQQLALMKTYDLMDDSEDLGPAKKVGAQ